jgi:predicted AlkP superfamily phosphohydrolase/phosphomutase
MLQRTPTGVLACVFDGTDRIQHMFMRYLDPERSEPEDPSNQFKRTIEDAYVRMDKMIGRVLDGIDPKDRSTLLVVMSDHGFKTFRRGVNLNSWLHQNGYLALKEGRDKSGEWFEGVDWKRTKAFALGLGGIFLNVKGREGQGIVEPSEAKAVADEIAAKLTGLVDPASSKVGIKEVFAAHRLYHGAYGEDAPDVIVGYEAGWRASWDGVRGIINDVVFDDNTKAWSGDHCIDPRLVPGVLITNHDLRAQNGAPSIMDMAPTLLDLFGVPTPSYMDGKSLVQVQ